jgi:hypothetical protein
MLVCWYAGLLVCWYAGMLVCKHTLVCWYVGMQWDPSVLDHEFKEDEQWGDLSTIPSSFNEVGEYKHRVALQHHSHFQRQDGNSTDDIIDQCIFVTHSSPSTYEFDNTLFYDTYDTEILDAPTSSQILTPKHTINRESISRNYGPCLVGFLLVSFKKPSNIRHNMHVFQLLLC